MNISIMKKLSQDGLTIVELLVTIAVAAVVITALTEVVTGYLHIAQRGRYLSLANSFAESEMEALRNQGYNSLTIGSTSLTASLSNQLPPSRSASMSITSPQTGLKQIFITVSYTDNGVSSTYSYTTYIGELGVGQ